MGFEFRLLTLLPFESSEKGIIHCELRTESLIEPPSYLALSYCWGSPDQTAVINVNGEKVDVTTNLHAALSSLRRRKLNTVWVDALCINQNDTFERGLQITRMGLIYSKASKVIAWLGEGTEAQERAMSTLADSYAPFKAAGLKRLLHFEYWRRVWIIQELSKAKSVQLMLAKGSLSWEILESCIEHGSATEARDVLKALCKFRMNEQKKQRSGLLDALLDTRHTRSSDPRDKIFALLGITSNGSELVPTPNYKQSFVLICQNLFESLGQDTSLAKLILLSNGAQTLPFAPSWLPDWSHLRPTPWVLEKMRNEGSYQVSNITAEVDDFPKTRSGCLLVAGELAGQVISSVSYNNASSALNSNEAFALFEPSQMGVNECYSALLCVWIQLCGSHWFTNQDTYEADYDQAVGPAVLTALLGTNPPEGPAWHEWRHKNLSPESEILKPLQTPKAVLGSAPPGRPWIGKSLQAIVDIYQETKEYGKFIMPEPFSWKWGFKKDKLKSVQANQRMLLRGLELMSVHKLHLCSSTLPILEQRCFLACDQVKACDIVAVLRDCPLKVVLRKKSDGWIYIGSTNIPTFQETDARPTSFNEIIWKIY